LQRYVFKKKELTNLGKKKRELAEEVEKKRENYWGR
jgi:hypothetical protein